MTTSCAYFHFARETAGASSARHSPRPLIFRWRNSLSKTRARAARSRTCVCDRGVSRILPSLRAKRSNPSDKEESVDCFVAPLPCANASRLSQAMTISRLRVWLFEMNPFASPQPSPTRGEGAHCRSVAHWRDPSRKYTTPSHNSRALLNENEETRRVFSSRIKVRVIGGSARWLQFSRSQSRQLTPIGVPSAFSRSIPVA